MSRTNLKWLRDSKNTYNGFFFFLGNNEADVEKGFHFGYKRKESSKNSK
jgi:hypothetical protein